MKSIAAVGFDSAPVGASQSASELTRAPLVDYTLAQYKPETFEDLAYRQACGKLVAELGYPPEVASFQYDCGYMLRGLAVRQPCSAT
jgi:hypothetical protein